MHRNHTQRLLVLFPGALGDFLCALPSILALCEDGEVLLVANPSALELIEPGPFRTASIHRREVADLFAAEPLRDDTRKLFGGHSIAHSWSGYGDPRFAERLAAASGGEVHIHRFRGMQPGEHASDYYARCVGRTPTPTRVWITADDEAWAAEWCRQNAPRRFVMIHPGSGAPRKNWEGFPDLARQLRSRGTDVIVMLGPAETEHPVNLWSDVSLVRNASLRKVGALLQRASLYVGNDSGISHLAATVGAPSLVLFGPASDAATWAPRGLRVEVITAPAPCERCGPDRFCMHALATEQVARAIATGLGRTYSGETVKKTSASPSSGTE
ncbi:MAG: glycosyltransferase family 9 protein [Deltaproteobacteria bacterium]|nr:glycosyltransferase family 9 protein [Deltaproteobacteria bacterium]MBI3390073.1 glycosyltransferase family 9 protein [Deltaproteobacteria bacterium]